MDALEQDTPEILAQTDPYPLQTIPVEVCGPVETRELPARNSSLRAVAVGQTTAIRIAGHDARRKSLRLLAYDATGACTAVGLGNSKNEAEGAFAFVLPLTTAGSASVSQMMALNSISEVWAVAITKGCTVSVTSESWL